MSGGQTIRRSSPAGDTRSLLHDGYVQIAHSVARSPSRIRLIASRGASTRSSSASGCSFGGHVVR